MFQPFGDYSNPADLRLRSGEQTEVDQYLFLEGLSFCYITNLLD